MFPAHPEMTLPLQLGKESFDQSTSLITVQATSILGFAFLVIRTVRRNRFNAILF